MTTLTREPATDGQIELLTRMATDAARKSVKAYVGANYLSKEGAERLKSNHDFVGRIHAATILALAELSTTDKYKNEEVKSNYAYPPEYKGPKPILEQVQALKQLFPQLDITATLEFVQNVLPTLQLPAGAEGWFAIPRWQKIADIYGSSLEQVLALIASKRNFYNYRKGELDQSHLRQHARTVAMLEQIGEQQKGDILIVPSQFGLWHRGRSVRRAREVIACNPIEFGSCPFMVGCMALTHPERYVRFEELDTDCPGGEYAPDAGGGFSESPLFDFYDDELGFVTRGVDAAYDVYGSASAFLPQ